ncbi:MAG: class I SAM-dependent methyltransferase, partial [Candidatus Zixiibacteriota bacterium]
MSAVTRTRIYENRGMSTERFPVMYDIEAFQKKADKVVAVCQHFSFRPLSELVCLDLGSSTGIMSERFAESFRTVVALDVDTESLKWGKSGGHQNNIEFLGSDGTEMPLADNSIDVVICNQIYEHVNRQEELMSEIFRVLKYDGFCYFGAGNRYVLIEGHYSLPFLSWLPRWLAGKYIKLVGKKEVYDVRLLSLGKLKRLTRNFWRHDYTNMIFENPENFCADDMIKPGNIVSRLPRRLFTMIYPL